jgi:hypothetical protein
MHIVVGFLATLNPIYINHLYPTHLEDKHRDQGLYLQHFNFFVTYERA